MSSAVNRPSLLRRTLRRLKGLALGIKPKSLDERLDEKLAEARLEAYKEITSKKRQVLR